MFSTGVGLNILSTWVLLLGLLGLLSRFWLFTLPATLTLLAAAVCALPSPCGTDCQSVLPSGADGQSAAFLAL